MLSALKIAEVISFNKRFRLPKGELHSHSYIITSAEVCKALFALAVLVEGVLRPALIIAVPVGFVNVVESKEKLFAVCEKYNVPAIAAMWRQQRRRSRV